jgi:hypothetical protein
MFGVTDSDQEVEKNKREIAVSLEISDDEQGQQAEKEVGKSLSLPPHSV